MITVPLFLFAGLATWLFWRSDLRAGVLIAALVCGYALAASPLASGIDAFGHGLGDAVQSVNDNASK